MRDGGVRSTPRFDLVAQCISSRNKKESGSSSVFLSLCVCKTIHYITYYLLVFLVLCSGIPPPSIAFTVSVVCSQRIRGKKENAKSSVACLVDAKTDESHIKMNCRHTVCEYACIEHIVPANLKLVFAHRNFSNGIKGSAQPYFRKIFSRKQHKN